ncbi:MAG: nickel pincer cofactor biosynthesis protein LarC [Thermomicrobiales bacterium]|nr:nickel pincer cofactor biosynthesis protein LarC [Thermomicrobiales bacterium]
MMLGALLDAGLPLDELRGGLAPLPLDPWEFRVERIVRHGLTGTRCAVIVHEERHSRRWTEIRGIINTAPLPEPVRQRALAIFERLAEAEAGVHGMASDDVHFHEVGGTDAIVDIVGTCLGLHALGVERITSDPPRLGSGWVTAAHGQLPVPAPATAALLARANAPVAPVPPAQEGVPGELLTPTGAAILTTLAEFRRPAFAPGAIGYGFGGRELPWPNALRVWIGETTDAGEPAPDEREPDEIVLETNLDDMNPQFTELLLERLFAAGALDVWLTPAIMKKGRPATIVSAIAPAGRRAELERVFIEQTTTLGVRCWPVQRTKAERRFETTTTRWGEVRLKLRGWRGRVIDARPEYDDCLALARAADVPIREVWNEAHRLGEVYVGQRWSKVQAPRLRAVPRPDEWE